MRVWPRGTRLLFGWYICILWIACARAFAHKVEHQRHLLSAYVWEWYLPVELKSAAIVEKSTSNPRNVWYICACAVFNPNERRRNPQWWWWWDGVHDVRSKIGVTRKSCCRVVAVVVVALLRWHANRNSDLSLGWWVVVLWFYLFDAAWNTKHTSHPVE